MKKEEMSESQMFDLAHEMQYEMDQAEYELKYEKERRETDLRMGDYYARLFVCGPNHAEVRAGFEETFENDPEVLAVFEASVIKYEKDRTALGLSVEDYRSHWGAIDQSEIDRIPKTVALFHDEAVIVTKNDDGKLVFKVRENNDQEGMRAIEIAGDATTDNHFNALVLAHGAEAISNEWDWEFESRTRLDPDIPLDFH